MGCGTSKPSRSNGRDIGWQAYTSVKNLALKQAAPIPESQQGKEEAESLTAAFGEIVDEVRASFRSTGNKVDLEGVSRIIASSQYVIRLGASRDVTRTFAGKWITFSYPDNGHWKVVQDPASGVVRIDATHNIIATNMNFSFGPMRSEVNSRGYTDMFRSNLAQHFAGLPKIMGGATVMEWEQDDEPTYAGHVADIDVWQWYVRLRIHMGDGFVNHQQLEIHGMRVESAPTRRGNVRFGLNCSMNAPAFVFAHLEPVFRSMLQTVQIVGSQEAEDVMHKFWKQ